MSREYRERIGGSKYTAHKGAKVFPSFVFQALVAHVARWFATG